MTTTIDSPVLIMITGLPGTGKTTLAKALATQLNVPHLNSDKLRVDMGMRGRYDITSKTKVYDELISKVSTTLANSQAVVVDATMYKMALRNRFHRLAVKSNLPIAWIETKAEESIIEQRVAHSRPYSEADYDVYQKIKASYEPLEGNYLTLHTDQLTLVEMISRSVDYINLVLNQSFYAGQ